SEALGRVGQLAGGRLVGGGGGGGGPASFVEVLGVAGGVVLEGDHGGRRPGAGAAGALPHQPPEQPPPRPPPAVAAAVARQEVEPPGAPVHGRQPRRGGHAAGEVGGMARRRRLTVHLHV
uniref:Uncharacterized protein n=1 Tax=Triticum urartu TaxID=4572 RepID=A0A8R7K3F9_TRIUA